MLLNIWAWYVKILTIPYRGGWVVWKRVKTPLCNIKMDPYGFLCWLLRPFSSWICVTKSNAFWSLVLKSLLTAEDIWFKYDLYLRFIPPINIWNICIDLRPFLKCKEGPFSRSWRSPRSNNLEIQNDKNSKWKLVKTRWNPKFGFSDLENDLLTSTTSEVAEWIFSKTTFFKSAHQAEKNEL